jgi:hypothetical protein
MKDYFNGNGFEPGPGQNGWFIGAFMPKGDPRHNEDTELKWCSHKKGEERRNAPAREDGYTVSILISGKFVITLDGEPFILQKQGDYLYFGPGLHHSWKAEEDSVVLSVRWPSAIKS